MSRSAAHRSRSVIPGRGAYHRLASGSQRAPWALASSFSPNGTSSQIRLATTRTSLRTRIDTSLHRVHPTSHTADGRGTHDRADHRAVPYQLQDVHESP